ncbi:hypothetical protein [Aureimonas sp. OT7]|uniref:hypothetical protein n=1 Tax=Aureimonas sp. OT7 TaxID=2816454 RepID=UPI0019D579D5|nr:hypothetical protein [Aureimonas sp. OT7]
MADATTKASTKYRHLLSPGKIGKMEVRNRLVVTAMGVSLAEQDGSIGEVYPLP